MYNFVEGTGLYRAKALELTVLSGNGSYCSVRQCTVFEVCETDGQMDGCMDGWMHGCMDAWMGGMQLCVGVRTYTIAKQK